MTSSLLISSLEWARPGISPLFFSQKMDAKEPEKKMPSTAAKATIRSPEAENIKKERSTTLTFVEIYTHGCRFLYRKV